MSEANDEHSNIYHRICNMLIHYPWRTILGFIIIVIGLLLAFLMTEPGVKVLNLTLDTFSGKKYVPLEDRDRQMLIETTISHELSDNIKEFKVLLEKMEHNVGTNSSDEEKTISCGINNVDIGRWELSVVSGNKYNLKLHDRVVLYNKDYSDHTPTAVFYVTSESDKKSDDSLEVYMTEESAYALDIPEPNYRGKFSVVIRKIER